MYTAGVVGGLSLTAACAPSKRYLNMTGPLTVGLGVVCVTSIGEWAVACHQQALSHAIGRRHYMLLAGAVACCRQTCTPLLLACFKLLCASAGGLFARPGTAVFSGLHAVYMYGGLVLFGGMLLYDTQRIIRAAETGHHYDPVNQ